MIIDSNVLFGFELQYRINMSIERVLEIMDDKKTDKAVITNLQCKYYDFIEGNDETACIVKKYPDRFYGLMSFNLSRYFDIEREVERGIKELGLSGIRFFYTDSFFSAGWGSSFYSLSMLKVLNQIYDWGVPVFLEPGFPFKDIKHLALEYPDIPIIASGAGCGNINEVIPAVEGTNNLYLEISTMDLMDGVTTLARYAGAEKVIFGTGMPYNCPSPEKWMVKTSEISEEDKEKIFSGNILNILGKRRVK